MEPLYILSQVANDFDYVAVPAGAAPAGTYKQTTAPDLTATTSGIDPIGTAGPDATGAVATIKAKQGVFRSLNATNGANIITPDQAVNACEASSSNGIIPGSR